MILFSERIARISVTVFFTTVSILLGPMLGQAQQAVSTSGGTTGYMPKFSGTSTIVNSQIFDNGVNVGIGVGKSPNTSVKLDVGGAMIMRGNMIVSRSGNATASKGFPSYGFEFFSNAYNSSTKSSDNPYFVLQSEPTGNNTASPSATFNLLFSNNGAAAAETGFYINPNGTLHFASAQTFPIAAGPQGPQGPAGPTGPQGPAGTISLPFIASSGGSYVFDLRNNGTSGGGGLSAQGSPGSSQSTLPGEGVTGRGGDGNAQGGTGVLGIGGTPGSGQNSLGGTGVVGVGAATAAAGTSGGYGGDFRGGRGQVKGGGGIFVEGADGVNGGSGGDGIVAYAGTNGGYAGEFSGDVAVFGNLSKSGGSFKIDHPLDPENQYLSHSFVESPDMMNIYNGNIVTDGRGEAVVTMPDYFEALNRDFRYQLTVIGQFAQAIVGSEIEGRSFTIRTDKPGVKVSWMVTGIRQDAWANAHRIPVNEEKPEKERGHYTHPELFGHAGEPSITEIKHSRPKSTEVEANLGGKQ